MDLVSDFLLVPGISRLQCYDPETLSRLSNSSTLYDPTFRGIDRMVHLSDEDNIVVVSEGGRNVNEPSTVQVLRLDVSEASGFSSRVLHNLTGHTARIPVLASLRRSSWSGTSRIVSADSHSLLHVYDVANDSGEPILRLKHRNDVRLPRAIAEGVERDIFVGGENGPIQHIDLSRGGTTLREFQYGGGVCGLGIDLTHSLLFASSNDTTFQIWDIRTYERIQSIFLQRCSGLIFDPSTSAIHIGNLKGEVMTIVKSSNREFERWPEEWRTTPFRVIPSTSRPSPIKKRKKIPIQSFIQVNESKGLFGCVAGSYLSIFNPMRRNEDENEDGTRRRRWTQVEVENVDILRIQNIGSLVRRNEEDDDDEIRRQIEDEFVLVEASTVPTVVEEEQQQEEEEEDAPLLERGSVTVVQKRESARDQIRTMAERDRRRTRRERARRGSSRSRSRTHSHSGRCDGCVGWFRRRMGSSVL